VSWRREVLAVLRKEATSELRSRSGLVTTGLFSLLTVISISMAAFGRSLSGNLAAGLIWVALAFASVVALPRTFLVEAEQGTDDFLHLTARPHAVFWGKLLYNLGLMLLTGAVLSFLFVGFTGLRVEVPWLFVLSLFGGCASLAGAVTLCGALVAQAANRAALAGVVSLPILLPLVFLGVSGMRVALGEGIYEGGVKAGIGIVAYAAATIAMGPHLYAAIWKK
jgi:heme exporter protein B